MGVMNNFTPPNSPPPPGPGLMGEGTTGVTPNWSVILPLLLIVIMGGKQNLLCVLMTLFDLLDLE